MRVYLDYLKKDRINKEFIETPSWIKESKSAMEFVENEFKSKGINGVVRYTNGEYRLLPLYPNDENFIPKPSLPIYKLVITLTIERYGLGDYRDNEYLVAKWSISKVDDPSFEGSGYVIDLELDNVFDKIRWRVYDLGISEYNSFTDISIGILSDSETKTFSTDTVYPEDPSELAEIEVGTIVERIKKICKSNFNTLNVEVDVTNLKYTINYNPRIKTDTIINF